MRRFIRFAAFSALFLATSAIGAQASGFGRGQEQPFSGSSRNRFPGPGASETTGGERVPVSRSESPAALDRANAERSPFGGGVYISGGALIVIIIVLIVLL
jgi:hypothetical protein